MFPEDLQAKTKSMLSQHLYNGTVESILFTPFSIYQNLIHLTRRAVFPILPSSA